MNTRQLISESNGPVSLSASYNGDCTCFAVGLDTGFCIFNAETCELETSRDFNAGIGIAEMLGRTNYVALVGGGKQPKFPQNKVIIWDDGKQKVAITLELRTQVHRVRLSRSRIIIALQNSTQIYEFSSPPKKLSAFETVDNHQGLCCLGPKVVAFPGQTPGKVQLVDLSTGNISIIPAHETPLRAMDLSANGEILATASERGTLIKVFSTANCAKIAEFRRGVDPADVFSIKFSPNSELLAVTSDKSTLHVFGLIKSGDVSSSVASEATSDSKSSQKWGFLSKLPLMPRAFSDVYSFASAHFESNDNMVTSSGSGLSPTTFPVPGLPGGRGAKGILGWQDDNTILVIGAGRNGRWEKFVLVTGDDGLRHCIRDSWKHYLGQN